MSAWFPRTVPIRVVRLATRAGTETFSSGPRQFLLGPSHQSVTMDVPDLEAPSETIREPSVTSPRILASPPFRSLFPILLAFGVLAPARASDPIRDLQNSYVLNKDEKVARRLSLRLARPRRRLLQPYEPHATA